MRSIIKRRWAWRLAVLCGTLAVLMFAAGLIAGSLLTGSIKEHLIAAIGNRLGVPVSVQGARFDLAAWLRLQPAITLEDVAVGNPSGFHAKSLLHAKRVSAEVALLPLLQRKVEVNSIRVEHPRITIERNPRGVTNAEAFVKRMSSPAAAQSSGSAQMLSIDDLHITSGEVVLATANGGELPYTISDIDVRVRDFAADRSCRLEVTGKLLGGRDSGFHIEGRAGPFAAESLPLDGTASVRISPAEIPAKIRKARFGNLLGAPGEKSRLILNASVQGDLYRKIAGPAKLVVSGVLIGKDEGHVLPASGETPAAFQVSKPISDPAFQLTISRAKLQIGEGEWNGGAEFQMQGGMMSGSGYGSIHRVQIDRLLGSVTSAGENISGLLEVKSYTAQFAGKSADEILDSLSGTGKFSISNGRLAALDLLATMRRALARPSAEAPGAAGNTPFTNVMADLTVNHSRLELDGIMFDSPALNFSGKGVIGFDHSLRFDLESRVSGGLAHTVNKLAGRMDAAEATVPVLVAGTVESPRIRPDVRKFANGALQGIIESLLKKRQ